MAEFVLLRRKDAFGWSAWLAMVTALGPSPSLAFSRVSRRRNQRRLCTLARAPCDAYRVLREGQGEGWEKRQKKKKSGALRFRD